MSSIASGTRYHVANFGSNEATAELVARSQANDGGSVQAQFVRCLPALRRWAQGRLPACARDLANGQDLVQEALMHALGRVPRFVPRHQGAMQVYLRQAVVSRIREAIRGACRAPATAELAGRHAGVGSSPLEQAVGADQLERYEAALERLRPADREAIVARLELQQGYEEIAAALHKPSAAAARVAVTRALMRLVKELDHAG